MSAQEKAQQIASYKKVGVLGKTKREVEYVVAKKGVVKRMKQPAGVKGHFMVVDPRMKDTRGKLWLEEKVNVVKRIAAEEKKTLMPF